MKKLVTLLLCLSMAAAMTACSSSANSKENESSTTVSSEVSSEVSAASSLVEESETQSSEAESANSVQTTETKTELEITTDDLVGATGFDLAEIANGSSPEAVLSALGITEDDLNPASTDSTWYIDCVSINLDGYKFCPRIDFWNNEVFVVYLCAAQGTDATAAHAHFSEEFSSLYGESEPSGDALIWTKAETRLWENQSVAFGSTSNCYAIEIQRVAA